MTSASSLAPRTSFLQSAIPDIYRAPRSAGPSLPATRPVHERTGITDDDLKGLPALVGGPVAESSSNAFRRSRKLAASAPPTGFDIRTCSTRAHWLRQLRVRRFLPPMIQGSLELPDRITQIEVFGQFLHRTFPGKTFSIRAWICRCPVLDAIIASA
jgi:hypothetical protein